MTTSPRTLIDVLRDRANDRGAAAAYTFLLDGEHPAARLTYAELDNQARSIAAALQSRGVKPGDRALLLYSPGLAFIPAFFGCLYAGVIAVPCYPPHPAQLARTLPRLVRIVSDAEVAVVLSTSAITESADAMAHHAPPLRKLPWLATDTGIPESNAGAIDAGISGDTLAFLQYTSGSTSVPKGVMISHANLLHNLSYVNYVAENDGASVSVSWLPVIHDMGLIEGVLEPLFAGYPAYLMAPAAFLQRPVRWLRAITRYRATNSGGPNFAYDLCVRKVTDAQRAELELGSWRVAYNGAEPIRRDTLAAFHERFHNVGFRWRSFYPVYGLAESTLVVSSGGRSYEPVFHEADAEQLALGRVQPVEHSSSVTKSLVACGPVGCGTRVVIVNPETCTRCDPGIVGEIWVSSPSVARGYWGRDAETAETFRAYLDDGDGPFLRTGDLGVMRGGELIVTGRLKDLLIVRGLKHYPQDIELTAEKEHHALRPGCSAAFSIEGGDAELVAIALEVDPRRLFDTDSARSAQLHEIIGAVKRAVAEQHGIILGGVSLLRLGGLPKTSSGKIRRHACRDAFLDQTLDELIRWTPGVVPLPGNSLAPSPPILRTGT